MAKEKKTPMPLIDIDFGFDRTAREESVLMRITAKPGFGAFIDSLRGDALPGWRFLENTPLAPMGRVMNLMWMPVTAMVGQNALRLTLQNDPPKPKPEKKTPHSSEAGLDVGQVEDARFTVVD